jgi:hypothetical protein
MGVLCISLHQRKPIRDRFGFIDPHSLAGRRLLKAGGGAIIVLAQFQRADHASACFSGSAFLPPTPTVSPVGR